MLEGYRIGACKVTMLHGRTVFRKICQSEWKRIHRCVGGVPQFPPWFLNDIANY